MSVTLLNLDQRLLRLMGDWIQADVTTNIAATNLIVSTALRNYDHGSNDYFVNYWAYIENKNNAGIERLIYDYDTGTGTSYVRGAALSADTEAATVRFSRSRFDDRKRALNDALIEIPSLIHSKLDDRTLVSGNILPNPSFEDWALTTVPDFWTLTATSTAAETTTAGVHRQGASCVKVTAGAANDYIYIDSNNYERLLDLRNTVVSFKGWVYPEVANDAYLVIYTIKADGTTQTLTSTTTCPAGKRTLVELKDQSINDDIVQIQFRLKVATNVKYVYFEDVRVTGKRVIEYLLPDDFQAGKLARVQLQQSSNSDDACDDIASDDQFEDFYGWDINDNGTYKYLYFPDGVLSGRRIRLIGYKPLTALSASSDTLAISDAQTNLLCEYAAYLLYTRMAGPMSADNSKAYYEKAQEHLMKFNNIKGNRMTLPKRQINVRPL